LRISYSIIIALAFVLLIPISVFAQLEPSGIQNSLTHHVEIPVGTSVPGCEETNSCWSPADITINVGDTVEWINVDTAAHTVTGGSPGDGPSGIFDSSLVISNAVYAFSFDDAGYYDYFCMVHPWMTGTITVGSGYYVPQISSPKIISNEIGSAELEQSVYNINRHEEILVKVFGNISNPLQGSKVGITITTPEFDSNGQHVFATDKGNYEIYFPFDYYSTEGTYKVLVTYSSSVIGQMTFDITHEPQQINKVEPERSILQNPEQTFELDFIESDDFRILAFNALPGEVGNNPEIRVNSGEEITITVNNDGKSFHAFGIVSDPKNTDNVIWNSAIGSMSNALKPGESDSTTFTAGLPGTYYYICTVPGHALQGMIGKFIVGESIYLKNIIKKEIPAPFVDPSKDPWSYVDRYENEASYKEWFDDNYSEYSSIYEAVGLDESTTGPYMGSAGALGSEHSHAGILVKIFGDTFEFSGPAFQIKSSWIHFEGRDGSTIHKHATGVTLGYLFDTLNIGLDDQCYVFPDGKSYCTNEDYTLKFFINEEQVSDIRDYELSQDDRILIVFGAETPEEIDGYLLQLESNTIEESLEDADTYTLEKALELQRQRIASAEANLVEIDPEPVAVTEVKTTPKKNPGIKLIEGQWVEYAFSFKIKSDSPALEKIMESVLKKGGLDNSLFSMQTDELVTINDIDTIKIKVVEIKTDTVVFENTITTKNNQVFTTIVEQQINSMLPFSPITLPPPDVLFGSAFQNSFQNNDFTTTPFNSLNKLDYKGIKTIKIDGKQVKTHLFQTNVESGTSDFGSVLYEGKYDSYYHAETGMPLKQKIGFSIFGLMPLIGDFYMDISMNFTPVDFYIPSKGSGGCLIATATYGSELAPQVQQLRELRDNSLLSTESGTNFMNIFNDFYYSFSPYIADYERENPVFREMVKIAITPMITSLSILNYVDIDSEAEVLGYGISLILLNIGMYIGIPAIVIVGIRKRF